MYAFKWAHLNTRSVFGPDDGAGGSEAPASSSGDGGGGGSAPAATPSAPPSGAPSTPSDAGTASGFDWGALGSNDDLDFHEKVTIPAEPPAPPSPQEKPPPQPTPPPQQPEPPKPQEPPPTTATQTQPSDSAPPALSASDPWRIAEGLEANRDAVIAHLASSKFALSEAEVQELDTDVMTAVPKLLSRVFLESQMSMQKFLAQAVPGMVKQFNTVTSANTKAEDAFFAAHKALDVNNPQHRATAVRIATVYRQANPNIPLNQLIAEVGPMVMAALRVNAPPVQTPSGISAPALPKNTGGFRPAVNGGGGVSPQPSPGNPWEGLGRSFDE